ncbi:MAG: methyl-accepting chemotaxis protein [Eubacterium sp.]|nr:methyl-accepting chemotaxis protein [Eubacterium sp.]
MNKNKPKVSIKVKVLVASLIPLFLVTLVISLYSLDALRTGMQDEALSGLRELCYSVSTAYDAIAEGDYRMDGDNLIKGEYNITENEDLIDNFTKNSDSDITIFYGDTRRATSLKDSKTGKRILGTKASDAVIEATLKSGEEFTGTDIEINEANYYAVYVPIKSGDGSIVGMVFAGQPSQEIDAVINSHMRGIFILAIIFIIVAAVVVFFVVSRIGSVITKTSDMLLYVSEGNLTLQVDSKMLARKDELGIMVSSLQKLAEQIKSVVTDLKQLSDVLSESGVDLKDFASSTNNAADEISRAVEDMSQGSVSQAEDVENATVQVAEMGNSIENIVDEIENLYSNSEKMEKSKNEAEKIVNELAASSDHTYNAVKRIEKQVKLTDESVTQIQQAVALITSIAEETNLLSLNASIEAARAGEAGKGFAVVASQIQKLAEESNSSAASIADVIENLSYESRNTVEAMNNMHDIIIDQQQKLGDTETKFSEVSAGIQSSLEQINQIRDGSEVCDQARIKVTDIIQNLSAISEQNAAATEQTSASMQELNSTMTILADKSEQLGNLAVQINKDLDFFKI